LHHIHCIQRTGKVVSIVHVATLLLVRPLKLYCRYYATAKMPILSSFPDMFKEAFANESTSLDKLKAKRKLALICGSGCSLLMGIVLLNDETYTHSVTKVAVDALQEHSLSVTSMLCLGLAHFYFIEVGPKGDLPVRPYGYLSFITPLLALPFCLKVLLF